jgi:hypothetical protein
MVVTSVNALPTVRLCKFYAVVLDTIDSPDMDAVRTDDFHVLFDARQISH